MDSALNTSTHVHYQYCSSQDTDEKKEEKEKEKWGHVLLCPQALYLLALLVVKLLVKQAQHVCHMLWGAYISIRVSAWPAPLIAHEWKLLLKLLLGPERERARGGDTHVLSSFCWVHPVTLTRSSFSSIKPCLKPAWAADDPDVTPSTSNVWVPAYIYIYIYIYMSTIWVLVYIYIHIYYLYACICCMLLCRSHGFTAEQRWWGDTNSKGRGWQDQRAVFLNNGGILTQRPIYIYI